VAEAPDVERTVRKLEELLDEIAAADPQLRERAEEVVRLLMQLYGAGLSHVMAIAGPETAPRLAEDKLVGSLLLLHGLHPVDPSTRIGHVLRRMEGHMAGHRLHLAALSEDVARIRVELNGGPIPHALAQAIEQAIADCAPEIGAVQIEGLPERPAELVQIAIAPPVAG